MVDARITLNDGRTIPQLGLGVWQIPKGKKCEIAVRAAIDAGYRHIDTAWFYGNEESVGAAIRDSRVPRENIFVTTKLWNSEHGNPERSLDESLRRMKLDYVDLYLIHYPVRERLHSWRILEKFPQQRKALSIGVSNFTIRHLTELLRETETPPAVNQVEFHPYLFQRDLMSFCAQRNVALEAYSPLTSGEKLNDPKLAALARKYQRSPAQILIRWAIQHGLIVIPKSANPERIRENAKVFDFEISAEDMRILDGFNVNLRTCWDPTNAP